MKVRFTVTMIAALLIALPAGASINLNSSKSNLYRLTYPGDLARPEQAKTMLAEMDKMGPADEAKLKHWLAANFRRFGIAGDRIRKVIVVPRGKEMKEIGVILLTRPEDEAAAMAFAVKSSKSNSSE